MINFIKYMLNSIRNFLLFLISYFIKISFFLIACILVLFIRIWSPRYRKKVVFGSTPLINNVYWANSLKRKGVLAETYTYNFYSINHRSDWDRIISEEYRLIPTQLKPFIAFLESLIKYDIFVISFDGFFIQQFFSAATQAKFLRAAKKKVIVIPYGGDSYIYGRIRSTPLAHGLLLSYPDAARRQGKISRNVDEWCAYADTVIPGFMAPDGFGRWDLMVPSPLCLDLDLWKAKESYSHADGISDTVIVAHAPNHRGFKGTEFVINALENLQATGLKVELRLLEGLPNHEIKRVLHDEVDILVEQIIYTGHGLNGLEGMASGLPTISNLEDEDYLLTLRRWSYFNECPLVSASPESIEETLLKLITNPALRKELGVMGRQYVEKYHGLDSGAFMFENIFRSFEDKKVSLLNLYHPILGEYNKRLPTIVPPLIKNKLIV